MRLSAFIRSNREQILTEWESFARTLVPAANALNSDELRDHAEGMLSAIEKDLEQPQSKEAQAAKSKGESDPNPNIAIDAKAHGALRAGTGFTLSQVVSEFRALRASVLRQWAEAVGPQGADVEEITRFNEAVDEALAESIVRFADDLDHSKELFLGVLQNDLSAPLGAIVTSANQLLKRVEAEGPQGKTAARILGNSLQMQEVTSDLLDFIRTRLGARIPINRARADLRDVFTRAVGAVTAAFPESVITLKPVGKLDGSFDEARLTQALSSLIKDCVQHGANAPVTISAHAENAQAVVTIGGPRPVIPEEELGQIFAPPSGKDAGPSSSTLGLGLYVAQEIIASHGGVVSVESNEDSTMFTIKIPNAAQKAPSDA